MRGRTKLAARLAAVGVAVAAVGLPIVGATTANAAATPALTVTPNVGLTDGGSVTVSGTGYDADDGQIVYVLECSGTAGESDCDISNLATATVGGDGTFSTAFTTHTGTFGDGGCVVGGTECTIAASDISQVAYATASISFGPNITATPSSALNDGDSVTVDGSGFPATDSLSVLECSGTGGASDCDTANIVPATTDGGGAFSTTFTVHTGTIGSGTCDSTASNCFLVASDGTNTATAPITFAPTGAYLTITPNSNLKNGQTVQISGANFPSASNGQTAYVVECSKNPPATDGSDCDTSNLGMPTVHGGSFGPISFKIVAGSAFSASGAKGSCAYGDTCWITATTDITGADPTQSALGAITFAKTTPPTKVKTSTTAKASNKSVKKGQKFTISGAVKAGGKGVKGLKETLYAGKKKVASKTSGSGGKFSFKLKGAKKTTKYYVQTAAKTVGSKAYQSSKSKTVTVKHKK